MYFGSSLVINLKTVKPTAQSVYIHVNRLEMKLSLVELKFIIRPLSSLRREKRYLGTAENL